MEIKLKANKASIFNNSRNITTQIENGGGTVIVKSLNENDSQTLVEFLQRLAQPKHHVSVVANSITAHFQKKMKQRVNNANKGG